MTDEDGLTSIDDMRLVSFTLPSPHWHEVQALRYRVFVDEQKVPVELEQDEADATALHLAALKEGRTVGTLRILITGTRAKIGRVAVAPTHRRQGIARTMLRRAIEDCRHRGISVITLHAQTDSQALYDGFGFSPMGTEFMEAGIPHIRMDLVISASC